MSRAADEVLHFRNMIAEDGTGVSQSLGEILKRLRAHQRHQTYLDGGVSFKKFWGEGDELISVLQEQASKLREQIKGG